MTTARRGFRVNKPADKIARSGLRDVDGLMTALGGAMGVRFIRVKDKRK